MDERLNDYDWEQAFYYGAKPEPGHPECTAHLGGFDREDVEEIIAMDDGCNDGPDWIIAMKLKDGRFAYLAAGCDYTGWD